MCPTQTNSKAEQGHILKVNLNLSKSTALFQKCNTVFDAGVAMEKYIEPIIHNLFIAIRMYIPRSSSNSDLKEGKKSNTTQKHHPDKGLKWINCWERWGSVWSIIVFYKTDHICF